jgi:penicillin-binding protein 1A
MSTALKGEPVAEVQPTAGVVFQNGDWYFDEFAGSQGVTSLGLGQGGDTKLPKPDERSKILDLFRN